MSLKLNFGNYKVGDSFVFTTGSAKPSFTEKDIIKYMGPFDRTLAVSDYPTLKRISNKAVLEAIPGHVYEYRGRVYIFITNAQSHIEEVDDTLAATLHRIPRRIRSHPDAAGNVVDQYQHLIGPYTSFDDAATAMGVHLHEAVPEDACTKSKPITRFRGVFAIPAKDGQKRKCVHIRTQSFAEPRASLQMKIRFPTGLRYRCIGSTSKAAFTDDRNYGSRLSRARGLLGHLHSGGAEYSGFVAVSDFRKCTGVLTSAFLVSMLPKETRKMRTRFSIPCSDESTIADQRIEEVSTHRTFIACAPGSKSFVLISSTIVTFTDILVDEREHPVLPYFYGRQNSRAALVTNIPCVLNMDSAKLLKTDSVREIAHALFGYVCERAEIGDAMKLNGVPFLADRWRILVMIAIMFAHESNFLGLERRLVFWFGRDFDRFLFETFLNSMAVERKISDYVKRYVVLRIEGRPYDESVTASSFDSMLRCVDHLVRTSHASYRHALAVDDTENVHPSPPGLFSGSDDWKYSSPTTRSTKESAGSSRNDDEVWIFVDSKNDLRAMCAGENTQVLSIATRIDNTNINNIALE